MKRRNFLKNSTLYSAGLAGLGILPGAQKRIPKTDTHVHLIDQDQFQYPWLKGNPDINRSFSLEDFNSATQRSGIGKIVFMESGAATGSGLKEAHWVAQLAKKEKKIKGIIASLDLSKRDAIEKEVEQLLALKLVKGIRGPLKNLTYPEGLMTGLQVLAKHQLTFDLLLSPQLMESASKLVAKCPKNSFILDHIGNPNIKEGEMELWKNGIDLLSQYPNVNCKISGIVNRAGKDWTPQTLQPYVLYVIESFGFDRLVYGGDWPVVLKGGTYQNWVDAFESLTQGFSKTELKKLYYQNADRIYHLD